MAEIEPQQQRADLGLPLVRGDETPREDSVEDKAGGASVEAGQWAVQLWRAGMLIYIYILIK